MSRFIVLIWLTLIMTFASTASAQVILPSTGGEAEVAADDPQTREAVREMVSRLSDAEVRDMLLTRLDAVAEAAEAKPRSRSDCSGWTS